MQTDQFHVVHLLDTFEDTPDLAQVDTELVLLHAGCDLGMGMGIHLRIDTQGDRCHFSFGSSQLLNHLQFGSRLHIETEDVVVQSQVDLPV